METKEEKIERISRIIGFRFFLLKELENMKGKVFAETCRAAARDVVENIEAQ